MPRHYSKILVELPDSPADPPDLLITFDCDVCGKHEWRTHVSHLGTFVRALNDVWAALGKGDDGTIKKMAEWEPSANRQKVLEHLNRHFPDWKAQRLRDRH